MPFVVKHRGDLTRPLVCVYTCPTHGEFDAEVERDADGNAPDVIECGIPDDCWDCGGQPSAPGRLESGCKTCKMTCHAPCPLDATWTPSPIACRVRRFEVARGKYEKPERKTYLDTRNLGEGQDIEEFRAERRKIWRDHRMNEARKEFESK